MRHLLSVAALVALGFLAVASSESEPPEVSGTYDGPDTVTAGESFPFALTLDNGSDAPVTVERVLVPGDLVRALGVEVVGAEAEPYGDGFLASVPAVTVQPGQKGQVVQLRGTPYLSGSQGGTVELCEPGGNCHPAKIRTRVKGGAEHALQADWEVPPTARAGEPFDVRVTLRNVSGGDDLVESLGVKGDTQDAWTLRSSDPPYQGPGEEIGRTVWRYDLKLAPGDSRTVTWTGTLDGTGSQTFTTSLCPASETFCRDEKHTIVLDPPPAP
jgi:hypothetical protein